MSILKRNLFVKSSQLVEMRKDQEVTFQGASVSAGVLNPASLFAPQSHMEPRLAEIVQVVAAAVSKMPVARMSAKAVENVEAIRQATGSVEATVAPETPRARF